MQQGHVRLSEVEVTVLDEADHMADLGFLPCVKRILDKTPRDTQRLLFSATLDNGVDILVKRYLNSPVTHSVDSATSSVRTWSTTSSASAAPTTRAPSYASWPPGRAARWPSPAPSTRRRSSPSS
jgi:superfamily II DNA/RNA helicase